MGDLRLIRCWAGIKSIAGYGYVYRVDQTRGPDSQLACCHLLGSPIIIQVVLRTVRRDESLGCGNLLGAGLTQFS